MYIKVIFKSRHCTVCTRIVRSSVRRPVSRYANPLPSLNIIKNSFLLFTSLNVPKKLQSHCYKKNNSNNKTVKPTKLTSLSSNVEHPDKPMVAYRRLVLRNGSTDNDEPN